MTATPAAHAKHDALISIVVLLSAICLLGMIAALLGADANYDLRNYHFYNGWALFNKPVGYDIGIAQLQGYLHPLVDGLFYQLWRVLNHFPLIFTFVWSIPQAVAVWLVFLVAREVLTDAGTARHGLAIAAAFIGAGGAASVSVLGTSMSEGIVNSLLLCGVFLVLRNRGLSGRAWQIAAAGLSAGAAVALKLTAMSYLIAFGAAMLLAPGSCTPGSGNFVASLLRVVVFACGAMCSAGVIGGPWWWALYTKFGNPLFPFYNGVFHSPDFGAANFFDNRFLPKSLDQWLFYPLDWTLRKSTAVSEVPLRDARIASALIGSVVLVGWRSLRDAAPRPTDGAIWCAIWLLCGYLVWLKMFSILRYAAVLELMSGVVIVAALQCILPRLTGSWTRIATAMTAGALLLSTTCYPDWGRIKTREAEILDVSMPQVPPNSVVILLQAAPVSYVAAFEPPSVQFIGVHNDLIALDSTSGLQAQIEKAIRDAPGEIWGIETTGDSSVLADQSLNRYRLRRTATCSPILSNLDGNLRMCRLERQG